MHDALGFSQSHALWGLGSPPAHHASHSSEISMYGAPSARWVLVSAMLFVCLPLESRADSDADVVKVQEDWALVVGDANTEIASPQVLTLMSPQPERDAVYAIFELNHQNLPSYQPGG